MKILTHCFRGLAVAGIALDLVQHRVNPRCIGVVLVLLHDLVRGIPFAIERQFNGLEQIFFWRAHSFYATAERELQQVR